MLKESTMSMRICARASAVSAWVFGFMALSAMAGCVGRQELEIVAERMSEATTPAAEQVESLKGRHVELTKTYNQLRAHMLDAYDAFRVQFCAREVQASLASLRAAEAHVYSDVFTAFNSALDSATDVVDGGLSQLLTEIQRQRDLSEQYARSGAVQPLPGQYADEVRIALLTELEFEREQGLTMVVTGYQDVALAAYAEVGAYTNAQQSVIEQIGVSCAASSEGSERLARSFGSEALSPEAEYDTILAYTRQMAAVSDVLTEYIRLNALFGDGGVFNTLLSGAVDEFRASIGRGGIAPADGVRSADELGDSLESVFTTLLEPLRANFRSFDKEDVLSATGVDDLIEDLESGISSKRDEIENKAIEAIERVKSDVDDRLTLGSGV
jgi:hypothetical protein